MEQSVAAGEVRLRALRALGPAAPIGIEQELAQPGKPLHACARPRWRRAVAACGSTGNENRTLRNGSHAPQGAEKAGARERLQGVE